MGIAGAPGMIEIGVRAEDFAKFEAEVNAAFIKIEAALTLKYHGVIREAFTMLVMNSPQWSGNFTANWNIGKNSPDYSYSEIQAKDDPETDRRPFQRGRAPATVTAMQKLSKLSGVTLADRVYITNATPADTGDYLGNSMLNGQVNLRPVNLVDGKVALIGYTVDFINLKSLK